MGILVVAGNNDSSGQNNMALLRLLRMGRLMRIFLLMNKMQRTKDALRRRQQRRRYKNKIDLPVYRVVEILEELKANAETMQDRAHLDWILEMVSSDKLYTATINNTGEGGSNEEVQQQVAAWMSTSDLNSNSQKTAPPEETAKKAEPSAMPDEEMGMKSNTGMEIYLPATLTAAEVKRFREVVLTMDQWSFDIFDLS